MRRAALASALILLLAFAATASGAKRKPNVAVKKLFPVPSAAKAGDRFEVGGRLINGGDRRARARVEVTLRRELRGDPLAEIGSAKVRVPAGKKKNFSATATIPSGAGDPTAEYGEYVEAGELVVVACVPKRGNKGKRRCRAAKPPLVIEPKPSPTPPPTFSAGSRTLGDPLLPQLGNGGYDAEHYEIDLDYDPDQKVFDSATTTIEATATQNLSEFSLDFQDLEVSSVTVNGVPAQFEQVAAEPELSPTPAVTQPMKLVVRPAQGILDDARFTVAVDYSGEPQVITDPDESIEGWIPACYTVAAVETCDSAFVVGEPMGAQGWFPSNNYPSDKATFETIITVPSTDEAFGAGELVGAPTNNGDGTWTWTWSEDDPTATYLVTASNGDFGYAETTVDEALTGRIMPVYNAIDPSATPTQTTNINARLARNGEMIDFLGERYGPYPFDSYGAVYDRAPNVGYALEVQTKSHFASLNSGTSTYLHELAHQWFGNSVTLARWSDIWFNEGWAVLSEWEFNFETGVPGAPSPAQQFADNYASGPATKWEMAPAVLDGDPANLFVTFPTYTRGAMTLEGYREIVGDPTFFAFARSLQSQFAHGSISTERFIEVALAASGLTGDDLERLGQYFEQWLYGTVQPTLTPDDF